MTFIHNRLVNIRHLLLTTLMPPQQESLFTPPKPDKRAHLKLSRQGRLPLREIVSSVLSPGCTPDLLLKFTSPGHDCDHCRSAKKYSAHQEGRHLNSPYTLI